ncbi:mRNA export protein (contains WD40 repeats) [Phaffia rhodozyma]|uniref:mRNA export protein (Contains WD40 repeats) n=1 Tax=Phaffia rhodozyma TaxID=264483 RepID=A0A0F7SVJ9_PHARH|nr:mRNA export protein (contains WD40 repeats) [Phaffia rhodozyma]
MMSRYRTRSMPPFGNSNPSNPDPELSQPPDSISKLAFSPVAPILAVASWNNEVRLYEVNSNGQSQPKALYNHQGPVLDVAWTSDGSKLLSVGGDKAGRAYDLTTGQSSQVAAHEGVISQCRFGKSTNGSSFFITGGWDKNLKFWDLKNPQPVGQLALPERCYAMDTFGDLLVVGTAERKVLLYDLRNPGTALKEMDSPLKWQTRVIACLPSTDKPGYAIGSIEGRMAYNLVNEANAADTFSFKCHRKEPPPPRTNPPKPAAIYSVNTISFHKRYGTWVTGGGDGTFHIWDAVARSRLKSFTPQPNLGPDQIPTPVVSTAFNHDHSILAWAQSYDWSRGHAGANQGMVNRVGLHVVRDEETIIHHHSSTCFVHSSTQFLSLSTLYPSRSIEVLTFKSAEKNVEPLEPIMSGRLLTPPYLVSDPNIIDDTLFGSTPKACFVSETNILEQLPLSPISSSLPRNDEFSSSPIFDASSSVAGSLSGTPFARKSSYRFDLSCGFEERTDNDQQVIAHRSPYSDDEEMGETKSKRLKFTFSSPTRNESSSDEDTITGRRRETRKKQRREIMETGVEDELIVEPQGIRMPVQGTTQDRLCRRSMGGLQFLDQRSSIPRNKRGPAWLDFQVSMIDRYPSILVSSHTKDVYRIPSHQSENDFAPPLTCAFSYNAKRGGSQILCVGTEEGSVDFLNLDHSSQWDGERAHRSIKVHENAIFDVAWSLDDNRVVTSSGDQTAYVLDVPTSKPIARLKGHLGTIKTSCWDPSSPHVISTASRDGNIHVYDLRDGSATSALEQPNKRGKPGPTLQATIGNKSPVNTIRQAHGDKGLKPKRGTQIRSASRSPTSLLYLPSRPHTLISAGTGDSVVKLWDLRMHGSYSSKSPSVPIQESGESTGEKGLSSWKRSYGVSSLVLGKEGDVIYSLRTDNTIHTYTPYDLSTPLSQTYTHPLLRTSFYTRLALSSCGRYLTSGSTSGKVHIWEVGGGLTRTLSAKESEGIVLNTSGAGAAAGAFETTGVSWGSQGFASCADNSTVRMWRPNVEIAEFLRTDPLRASWNWSGLDDSR